MGVQFEDARKGKEFVPTYIGRFLKDKFRQNPNLRKKVPRRWITKGYVTEQEIKTDDK